MTEVTKASFGATADGRLVDVWTLRAGGYAAQVLTYGGILRSLTVPAPGGSRDIVLGCETLEDYERQDKYLGALVGRVANRIGGAAFELNGKSYPLAANSGPNCLHGGVRGFNQAVWQAREVDGSLVLTHVSPDGDEGFPGALEVRVTYSLTADGVLMLDYWAKSDADTLCNLTNHSYFNLLGHDAGTLAGQQVEIFADAITQTDENSTPTGALLPVEGTPFDLRRPRDFLEGLAMDHPQLALGNGYDHNFVLHTAPISPPVPGGPGVRRRSGAGVPHHPARPPALHRQLSGRHPRQGRDRLRPPVGLLSGDPELARRRPPRQLPLSSAPGGGGLPPPYCLPGGHVPAPAVGGDDALAGRPADAICVRRQCPGENCCCTWSGSEACLRVIRTFKRPQRAGYGGTGVRAVRVPVFPAARGHRLRACLKHVNMPNRRIFCPLDGTIFP